METSSVRWKPDDPKVIASRGRNRNARFANLGPMFFAADENLQPQPMRPGRQINSVNSS